MRLFHTVPSADARANPTTAPVDEDTLTVWSELDDRDLSRLLHSGTPDEQAQSFSALYDRYELMIRNYVLKQLNYREEDSLEAIGDTWLVFWRERANFVWNNNAQTENPLQSWLYGIARNRVKSKVRQNAKEFQNVAAVPLELVSKFIEDRLGDGSTSSPDDELPHEANRQINQLMQELKPTEKQIVTLRYYKGLTYAEISDQLGKTSAAVRTAHTRLIQKLRQLAESQSIGP